MLFLVVSREPACRQAGRQSGVVNRERPEILNVSSHSLLITHHSLFTIDHSPSPRHLIPSQLVFEPIKFCVFIDRHTFNARHRRKVL